MHRRPLPQSEEGATGAEFDNFFEEPELVTPEDEEYVERYVLAGLTHEPECHLRGALRVTWNQTRFLRDLLVLAALKHHHGTGPFELIRLRETPADYEWELVEDAMNRLERRGGFYLATVVTRARAVELPADWFIRA